MKPTKFSPPPPRTGESSLMAAMTLISPVARAFLPLKTAADFSKQAPLGLRSESDGSRPLTRELLDS